MVIASVRMIHMQASYWREDSHKEEVYKCQHNLCLGESLALKTLAEVGPSDLLPTTVTQSEKQAAHVWGEEVCREGHKGRLCQVCCP